MKNIFYGLNSRLDTCEERIKEAEAQTEAQRGKEEKKKKNRTEYSRTVGPF